jgi:cytochrome c oxidase assembly factor CtaG
MMALAYDGPPALTVSGAFSQWEVDRYLAVGIAVVAVLYVTGVVRMHRRGDEWSWLRTTSFLLGGLGTIVIATMSALGVYDDTLFTDHMIQHMMLSMVAPVFLALGAPVTLALRTLRPGGRRTLLAVLHSRVARLVTWTPIAWAHFVLLPFVLYHTTWYAATLEHDGLHELLHVQILLAGCMFFWPLLGLDPLPGRLSYPARMLVTFLSLPFHAILGLSVMLQTSLIAGDYYRALGRPWGPSLSGDQYAGGGVLWATGDLVGLLFFGTLFFQWQRAEGRTAVREDRQRDRVERRTPVPLPEAAAPVPAGTDRPWWEVDAGPLAERARREKWAERRD